MNKIFHPLTIQKGVVHIGNRPRMFISADYPYYRDDAANWTDRLGKLKALGITVITIYIPWRHHQSDPQTVPDFSGRTQPNRDVLGFLARCADLELIVIAKPGPFIHAELNYGGLPDWVCPCNNPKIEALIDSNGQSVCWSGARLASDGKMAEAWPLPAPFSPEFVRLTREWMTRVGEAVIQPNQTPNGPIVGIQVGNEGIYSNGQHAPWAYDYSSSALARFADFLKAEYRDLEKFNDLHGSAYRSWSDIPAPRGQATPDSPKAARLYVDWGAFEAQYMQDIFREWSAPLNVNVPVFLNQNPPLEDHYGHDAWLARVEPERWQGFQYGFTNWVGDVSANPSAFDRYLLTAKRFPGPNMEENWGFAELYDPAYVDASTSFYQTLSILNNGATGFNIYTGIGTAHADANLEVIKKAPYPDAAPITAEGIVTDKAEIARWLAKFFELHGEEFLASRTVQPAAWGVYLPHARLAVWSSEADPHAPRHGRHLQEFQKQMRALHLDYGILNLETATLDELKTFPALFLAGGSWMAREVQSKLADYARAGGRLYLHNEIPRFDENARPCDTLPAVENLIRIVSSDGVAAALADVETAKFSEGEADVWVRSHPQRDVHFVTVLIPSSGKTRVDVSLKIGERQQRLVLSSAPSAGALLRVENGSITDALIKGHNAFLNQSVAPFCVLDAQTLGVNAPGDFARIGNWVGQLPSERIASGEKTN